MLKIEQFPRFSLNASSRGPNVLFVFRLSHEPLSLRECVKVNLPRNYQGLKRLVKIQMSNFELSGQTEIDVHTDRDRNTRDTCKLRNQCSNTTFCLVHNMDNSKQAKWRTRHPGRTIYCSQLIGIYFLTLHGFLRQTCNSVAQHGTTKYWK